MKALSKLGGKLSKLKNMYKKNPQLLSYLMVNTKYFLPNIKNKAGVSSFTTSIQHYIGSSSWYNKNKKRKWKGYGLGRRNKMFATCW